MARKHRQAPLPGPEVHEQRRKNKLASQNPASPPTAQDAENRRRNKQGNPAPPPTAQDTANRRNNRAEGRNPAKPGTPRAKMAECCGKKLYQVTSGRVVAGKKKGETVELCDSAATRALVQAGHLLPVERTAVKKAEPKKEANDG